MAPAPLPAGGLLVGAATVTAAVAVAGTVLWPSLSHGVPLALVSLLIALNAFLATIPIIIGRTRRQFDLFEPTVIIGLIWFFAYVFPAIAILIGGDIAWLQWGLRAKQDTVPLLAQALSVSAAGLIGLHLAYYFPYVGSARRVVSHSTSWELDPRRFRVWSILIGLGALAMFSLLVAQVGGLGVLLSRLNDRVRLLSGLNYLAAPAVSLLSILLVAYAAWLRRGSRAGGVAVFALALVGFGVNVTLGSKTNVFCILLALLVTRHYLYKPVRPLFAVALGLGGVVLAMAFDLFFREFLVIKEVASFNLNAAPAEMARLAWFAFSSNAFVQLQGLMLIIDGVPDLLPFQLGRPYLAMVLILVPRGLFPGKPPIITEIFSRAYFPDLLSEGTSIPTSMVGEFYINFGVLGVLLGGIVIGAALRRAYQTLRERPYEPGVIPVYALIVATLLPWIRGDSFGPTVFFVSVVAPMWVLIRLSRRPASGN
jgi:oligosaccharide repeat unit polymerase